MLLKRALIPLKGGELRCKLIEDKDIFLADAIKKYFKEIIKKGGNFNEKSYDNCY